MSNKETQVCRGDVTILQRQYTEDGEWYVMTPRSVYTKSNIEHMIGVRNKWRDMQPNNRFRLIRITTITVQETVE